MGELATELGDRDSSAVEKFGENCVAVGVEGGEGSGCAVAGNWKVGSRTRLGGLGVGWEGVDGVRVAKGKIVSTKVT